MNDEDLENIFSAFEDYQPRRYQAFSEFAMEASGDTICYIKPVYTESIDLSFDLKRKRKRCINI